MKVNKNILSASILFLLISVHLHAQGLIMPIPPPPRPPHHPYHPRIPFIESIKVSVDVMESTAVTRIEQTFVNPNSFPLEGTFLFPLPPDAALSEFSMTADGKKMEGEILDAEKARKIYRDIVRKLRDPGLLEYSGKNLFKARLFPIPPHGKREIELKYSEILETSGNLARYVYSMGGVLPRPAPPFRTPAPEEPCDKWRRPPHLPDLVLSVEISSKEPLGAIYSPSHTVEVVRRGDRRASVHFEGVGREDLHDFFLYFAKQGAEFGVSLLSHKVRGEDGFFLLLVSPERKEVRTIERKDVVYVIDTSGSMAGEKIKQVVEAIKYGINTLNRGDRFGIVRFSTEVSLFRDELVGATEDNTGSALSFLAGFKAAGGTNIAEALEKGIALFPDDGLPHILVFLTDGLPTVGERDVATIAEETGESNKTSIRIFPFGVGYDVNTFLLDTIARDNHGSPDYIRPGEELESRISFFFEKTSSPALSDVRIDTGRIPTYDIYPKVPPDLYRGTRALLLGRYEKSGRTTLTLTGKSEKKTRRFTFDLDFPARERDNDFLAKIWATKKVAYLLNEIRLHGEEKELKEEVIALGKKYGIVTPYTSYLITEDEVSPRWSDVRRAVREKGEHFARTAPQAMGGADAVEVSRTLKTLAEEDKVIRIPQKVEYVAGKTFRIDERGVWIDEEYEPGPVKTVRIPFGSEEYFELLEDHPEVEPFLKLGEKVLFLLEGKAYEIY